MEENKNEKIIKKQKTTIIILSICFALSMIAILGFLGFYLNNNMMEITYADCYNKPNSFYTCFVVNISANSNKSIKVNDFTFKCDKGYVCMSYVEYNNNTYNSGESFVIYKNQTNSLKFYATLLENSETNKVYYKLTPVKILNSIKKFSLQQTKFFLK